MNKINKKELEMYSKKIKNKKIREAVKRGDLIPHKLVMAGYPKSRQRRIKQRTKHLRIAMELRRIRKALKLSQESLARKMKVKREFIARIESGRQNVTLDTLYRIAEATGKEFKFSFK